MNINKRFFALVALMTISFTSFTHCAEAPVARARSYTTVAVGSAALIGLIGVLYETILSTMSGDTSIVQTIANAFLQTTPAFVSLQKDIREVVQTKSEEEKAQAVTALKGLVALLEAPGDFRKMLPQSTEQGNVDVFSYAATATFVAQIQAIAYTNFYKLLDDKVDQTLQAAWPSQEGRIFYDMIKQVIVSVFGDILQKPVDTTDPVLCATHPVLFIDLGVLAKPSEALKSVEWVDLQKRMAEIEKRYADYKMLIDYKLLNEFIKVDPQPASATHKSNVIAQLNRARDQMAKKLQIVAESIAKNKGAAAISSKDQFVYVDPAFDITAEAIAQLNKEYAAVAHDFTFEENEAPELFDPQNMLRAAILRNSAEGINRAIESGADVNKEIDGQTPLMMTVHANHSNCAMKNAAKTLLEHGADARVLYFGKTLLFHALHSCCRDKAQTALLLAQHGVNLDNDIKAIWQISSDTSAFFELLELLLARDLDINDLWSESLSDGHIFSNPNSEQIFDFFMKHGANPNQIYDSGFGCFYTPLAFAISRDDVKPIEMLLNAGADINQPFKPNSSKTFTSLSYAINHHRDKIVDFLKQHGAIEGVFPTPELQERLHKAILRDSKQEVIEVDHAGADLHQAYKGKPAVLWAVELKHSNALEGLFNCGAAHYRTSHDLSLWENHTILVKALKLCDVKSAFILLKEAFLDWNIIAWNKTKIQNALDQGDFMAAIAAAINKEYRLGKSDCSENVPVDLQKEIVDQFKSWFDWANKYVNPEQIELYQKSVRVRYLDQY